MIHRQTTSASAAHCCTYCSPRGQIRFSRLEAAGSGIDRCTNPLYVDWAPDACPAAANDLFLAHYPWYWPAGLPKPGDLGEPHRKVALLKQCFLEAQSRNLRPGTCNALVPAETLAVCGQGSGVNPPCWEARFTNAAVLHLDGSRVLLNPFAPTLACLGQTRFPCTGKQHQVLDLATAPALDSRTPVNLSQGV